MEFFFSARKRILMFFLLLWKIFPFWAILLPYLRPLIFVFVREFTSQRKWAISPYIKPTTAPSSVLQCGVRKKTNSFLRLFNHKPGDLYLFGQSCITFMLVSAKNRVVPFYIFRLFNNRHHLRRTLFSSEVRASKKRIKDKARLV